jgi:hypothetical protein
MSTATRLGLAVIAVCALVASSSASFDLGPIVRVAQCRSQCLKKHSIDGSCEWWRHGETGCNEVSVHAGIKPPHRPATHP